MPAQLTSFAFTTPNTTKSGTPILLVMSFNVTTADQINLQLIGPPGASLAASQTPIPIAAGTSALSVPITIISPPGNCVLVGSFASNGFDSHADTVVIT